MDAFSALVEKVTRFGDRVAAALLFSAMALIVVNIILREVFKSPITGVMDFISLLSALVVILAVAFCALNNAQIAVEFLVDKLPPKAGAVIDSINNLVALAFWAVVSWYLVGYAQEAKVLGLVTNTATVPTYPFIFIMALGMFMLCLVLVLKFVESVRKVAA